MRTVSSRCHDKRLLEGESTFNKIVFDHTVHFEDLKRGKQLQCVSCHSQIVQGKHITVTESSCFICHFKESENYPQIKECYHCHSQETLTDESTSRYNHSLVFEKDYSCDKCHSNTIIGDGEVPMVNCYKCHGEQDRLEKYEDTDLMHSTHIAIHKIDCNLCHLEIQHKISKDVEHIADCKTCHTDYHNAQIALYTGEGGKGVSHAMPNVMLEKGLSCKGCHIFHEETGGELVKSDTFISEGKACESCHGEGFDRILNDWERTTIKKLDQTKATYNRASQEIKRSSHANKEQAASLLEDALFNMELVDKGKSVHNVAFSQELLLAAHKKITEALELVDSRYKPAGLPEASEGVPTQCSNCHAGIEEINASVFGMTFPHKNHLLEEKIDCSICHSNVRTHGEFIANKQSCAVCHHEEQERECISCHQLQKTFYLGGKITGLEIPPDIMAEAEAECTDCHHNDEGQIYRSNGQKCAGCHDEEYSEMFDDWQNSTKELLQRLTADIAAKKEENLTQESRQELSRIERIAWNVRLDGSSGIHNYMFIEELLTDLIGKLKSLDPQTSF